MLITSSVFDARKKIKHQIKGQLNFSVFTWIQGKMWRIVEVIQFLKIWVYLSINLKKKIVFSAQNFILQLHK